MLLCSFGRLCQHTTDYQPSKVHEVVTLLDRECKERTITSELVSNMLTRCDLLKFWCKVRRRRKLTQICIATLILCYIGVRCLSPSVHITGACNIPEIDIYSSSLDQSFWSPPSVICKKWDSLTYINDSGYLVIDTGVSLQNNHSNINCSFSSILSYGQDDIKLTVYRHFDRPVFVRNDFVHVLCENSTGQAIYSNLHYNVYNKEILKERKVLIDSKDDLSVIIIGIDSLSWVVARRKLTHTLKYLENDPNAYFMEGYTKVGDSTFSNLAAALLGRSFVELVSYPFFGTNIVTEAVNNGYIASHAEDWTYPPTIIGSFYPTYTHDLRSFIVAETKIQMYLKKSHNTGKNITHKDTNPLCFVNRFRHEIILNYSMQVLEAYKHKRKFVFIWLNEIGHHQSSFIEYADQDILKFLQGMRKNNHLEKCVVVIMSDHGPKYGSVPKSDIGRFSGRLPFLSLILPKQLTDRFPNLRKHLLHNRHRLTSPFDLHETLKDVINKNFKYQNPTAPYPRGISLFKEIPASRSCHDAGISENNCACYSQTKISVNHPHIVAAAEYIIHTINKLYINHALCSTLSLSSVDSAFFQYVPFSMGDAYGTQRYVVSLQTVPGNALYEATVTYQENDKINILGDINRRNKYEGQTDCVRFKKNEQFCYCFNK